MPNICPKCGQITDDRYVFCGFCGAPLDAAPAEKTGEDTIPAAPSYAAVPVSPAADGGYVPAPPVRKKKSHLTLFIMLGVLAVIAAVAAVVAVIFLTGGYKINSPQEALDCIIDSALSGEYEKMLDCVYEFHYSEEDKQDALSYFDSFSLDNLESMGIDKKTIRSLVKFEVQGQQKVSAEEEKTIRKTLADGDIPDDPIEEIVKADVKVTFVGEPENVDVFFAKADGGWYLLSSGNESLPMDDLSSISGSVIDRSAFNN